MPVLLLAATVLAFIGFMGAKQNLEEVSRNFTVFCILIGCKKAYSVGSRWRQPKELSKKF